MALMTDKGFRQYTDKYAKDENAFFSDFSKAFSKCVPSIPLLLRLRLIKHRVQAHPPRRPDRSVVRACPAQEDRGPGACVGVTLHSLWARLSLVWVDLGELDDSPRGCIDGFSPRVSLSERATTMQRHCEAKRLLVHQLKRSSASA